MHNGNGRPVSHYAGRARTATLATKVKLQAHSLSLASGVTAPAHRPTPAPPAGEADSPQSTPRAARRTAPRPTGSPPADMSGRVRDVPWSRLSRPAAAARLLADGLLRGGEPVRVGHVPASPQRRLCQPRRDGLQVRVERVDERDGVRHLEAGLKTNHLGRVDQRDGWRAARR